MTTAQELLQDTRAKVGKQVEWITLSDAAKILGVTIHSIRPLEWSGDIGPRKKVGRRIYVKKSAVLTYSTQNTRTISSEEQVSAGDFAQQVENACELVLAWIDRRTQQLGKEFVGQVHKELDQFTTEAKALVK